MWRESRGEKFAKKKYERGRRGPTQTRHSGPEQEGAKIRPRRGGNRERIRAPESGFIC